MSLFNQIGCIIKEILALGKVALSIISLYGDHSDMPIVKGDNNRSFS